jgi:hypothetical protein
MYWMKARDIPKYEAHFQKVSFEIYIVFLKLAIQISLFSAFLLIYLTYVCMFRSLTHWASLMKK